MYHENRCSQTKQYHRTLQRGGFWLHVLEFSQFAGTTVAGAGAKTMDPDQKSWVLSKMWKTK